MDIEELIAAVEKSNMESEEKAEVMEVLRSWVKGINKVIVYNETKAKIEDPIELEVRSTLDKLQASEVAAAAMLKQKDCLR